MLSLSSNDSDNCAFIDNQQQDEGRVLQQAEVHNNDAVPVLVPEDAAAGQCMSKHAYIDSGK